MLVSTSPDAEPPASLTPGQLLDARHVLDDQIFDALDDQHRRLAARVDALEAGRLMRFGWQRLPAGDTEQVEGIDHSDRPGDGVVLVVGEDADRLA